MEYPRLKSLSKISDHPCDCCGRPAATIEPTYLAYTLVCESADCLLGASGGAVNINSASKEKVEAMNMSKYAGTAFIGVDDIKSGPVQKTISKVEEGRFDKPLVTFEDGSKLGLNKTNTRTLMRAFGNESSDWVGQEVELYVGVLEYQGTQHDSVLINAA